MSLDDRSWHLDASGLSPLARGNPARADDRQLIRVCLRGTGGRLYPGYRMQIAAKPCGRDRAHGAGAGGSRCIGERRRARNRNDCDGVPERASCSTAKISRNQPACPAPKRSGRRGHPDRSRPGWRSGGDGSGERKGLLRGERGYAAVRRDFSRLGSGSRVPGGMDSPSHGRLQRPGCASAAEMAGAAFRSGTQALIAGPDLAGMLRCPQFQPKRANK